MKLMGADRYFSYLLTFWQDITRSQGNIRHSKIDFSPLNSSQKENKIRYKSVEKPQQPVSRKQSFNETKINGYATGSTNIYQHIHTHKQATSYTQIQHSAGNDVDVLVFIREKLVSACDHTRVCYEFVMLKCFPRILVSLWLQ